MSNSPYITPPDLQGSQPKSDHPRTNVYAVLAVICIFFVLIGFLLPATRSAKPAAYRMQCTNNLKQIALALQSYEAVYGAFPPAATNDEFGNSLHSWRTLLLPYLEQSELYESIDFSKPWNHPNNAKAYQTTVTVYQCPSLDSSSSLGATTYQGVVGPHGFFLPNGSRPLSEITDSPSETLMLVEVPAANSVHWMEPTDTDELTVLSMRDKAMMSHQNGFHAAFVDGSVHFIRQDRSREDRQALISIAGDDNPINSDQH